MFPANAERSLFRTGTVIRLAGADNRVEQLTAARTAAHEYTKDVRIFLARDSEQTRDGPCDGQPQVLGVRRFPPGAGFSAGAIQHILTIGLPATNNY